MESSQPTYHFREEREWREWVDNHFIHLISPNVYRTWSESLETFRYFDKAGDWERVFNPVQRCGFRQIADCDAVPGNDFISHLQTQSSTSALLRCS